MVAKTKGADRETGIQVIARAGEILRLLAKTEQGTTLRSLADATGLPRSTVHRIVVALAGENLVVWDPGRGVAELGLGLISLALSRRQRLRDAVRPYIEALMRRVDETVDLVVLRGETVVFVDQVMAHQLLVVSAIGAVLPVHCTACGKALLAALTPDEVERILPKKLRAYTPHTITDRAQLLEELALIRSSRLAFDRDEHTVGVSAVGGVIRNAWGEVAGITIPVPTQRFTGREEELGDALLATCDELNGALLRV
jgi:DNA-binding IclR family transcriptional regulator